MMASRKRLPDPPIIDLRQNAEQRAALSQASAILGQRLHAAKERRVPTTLFLDYDGVLHPWPIKRAFEHAPALARRLLPHPEVRIVLSTSWVGKLGLEAAKAQLPPALSRLVVDSTATALGFEQHSLNRAEQIERYLALPRWPKIHHWVVLDDAACRFQCEERVIRCNPETGLVAADLEQLGRVLRAFLRQAQKNS
jgi:hypothetical protein